MRIAHFGDTINQTILDVIDHLADDKHNGKIDVRLTHNQCLGGYKFSIDCSCGKMWEVDNGQLDTIKNENLKRTLYGLFSNVIILEKMVNYRKIAKKQEELVKKTNGPISSLEV